MTWIKSSRQPRVYPASMHVLTPACTTSSTSPKAGGRQGRHGAHPPESAGGSPAADGGWPTKSMGCGAPTTSNVSRRTSSATPSGAPGTGPTCTHHGIAMSPSHNSNMRLRARTDNRRALRSRGSSQSGSLWLWWWWLACMAAAPGVA